MTGKAGLVLWERLYVNSYRRLLRQRDRNTRLHTQLGCSAPSWIDSRRPSVFHLPVRSGASELGPTTDDLPSLTHRLMYASVDSELVVPLPPRFVQTSVLSPYPLRILSIGLSTARWVRRESAVAQPRCSGHVLPIDCFAIINIIGSRSRTPSSPPLSCDE